MYSKNETRVLSGAHHRMLRRESGISEEDIARRGYYTARTAAEVPDVFPDWQRRAGLVIPTPSPTGQMGYQLRPDRPRKDRDGRIVKYERPHGSGMGIDVAPRMMEEVRSGDGILHHTEGTKKVDAAASRGLAAVGYVGVHCFAVKGTHGTVPLPDFAGVNMDREHLIVYDADARTNWHVQLGLQRLAALLEVLGARRVLVAYLPRMEHLKEPGKAGLDDFFAAGHAVEDLLELARPYEPLDVGAMRAQENPNLAAALGDQIRAWWGFDWSGVCGTGERPNRTRGHSVRDLVWAAIKCAAATGEVRPEDGALVFAPGLSRWGTAAALSRRALVKAIKHAEAEGLLEKLPRPDKRDAPQPYALLSPPKRYTTDRGSKAHEAQAAASSKALLSSDPGGIPFSDSPVSLPETPRLRWSSPGRKPRLGLVRDTRKVRHAVRTPNRRDYIRRIGKTRGAIIDHLERAGGEMGVDDLAAMMGYRRARDLEPHLAVLERLGIVWLDVDGDTVALEDRWRSALAEARELAEEPAVAERERAATRRRGREWRERSSRRHRGDGFAGPTEAGRENIRRGRAARARQILERQGSPPPKRPSPEEERVRRLVREGMARRFIGRNHRAKPPEPEPEPTHPLGCECLGCSVRPPRYATPFTGGTS